MGGRDIIRRERGGMFVSIIHELRWMISVARRVVLYIICISIIRFIATTDLMN